MTNHAIQTNPPDAGRTITTGGSDWLWAVFAVMLLSDLIMIFWTATLPRGTRVFHQIAVAILTTATIAYFAMASDLGDTGILPEFGNRSTTRAIWVCLSSLLCETTLTVALSTCATSCGS